MNINKNNSARWPMTNAAICHFEHRNLASKNRCKVRCKVRCKAEKQAVTGLYRLSLHLLHLKAPITQVYLHFAIQPSNHAKLQNFQKHGLFSEIRCKEAKSPATPDKMGLPGLAPKN